MFKTIRNVIKLIRLLSRLEWQEDTNSQTLKLGRLELQITSSDTIIKVDGITRFDTDYLLLICPPDLNPYDQPDLLENYRQWGDPRIFGPQDLDPQEQPDFLETFKHYGDDQRPGLCGCRDNQAGKEARHDKRGVCRVPCALPRPAVRRLNCDQDSRETL